MIQRWSHDYRFTLWKDTISGEWVMYKDYLAALAKKDKEIALWKKSFRAADKDNEELREENATLIADIEELKRFVRDITLELQDHRKKTPAQMDMLFQKAYTLYAKYDVENRKAIKTVEK